MAPLDAQVVGETQYGKVWVGAWREKNDETDALLRKSGIRSWMRCAKELPHDFPMDDARLTIPQLQIIHEARNKGIELLKSGHGDLLITCAVGANRSALVAGLILKKLTGAQGFEILQQIRARRKPRSRYPVLSNPEFAAYLSQQ